MLINLVISLMCFGSGQMFQSSLCFRMNTDDFRFKLMKSQNERLRMFSTWGFEPLWPNTGRFPTWLTDCVGGWLNRWAVSQLNFLCISTLPLRNKKSICWSQQVRIRGQIIKSSSWTSASQGPLTCLNFRTALGVPSLEGGVSEPSENGRSIQEFATRRETYQVLDKT